MKSSKSSRTVCGCVCSACGSRVATSNLRPTFGSPLRHQSTKTRKAKLPDFPARTRFAPSPTGNLHLGSIRTALFNYLLAKRTKGQFLLRLEDTDQKRTVPGAEERIYKDLRWGGLEWDEGPKVGGPYGPYRQSERTATYLSHVHILLERKSAYRCFCSAERLDKLNKRRHEQGLPLGYDRRCLDIPVAEAEEKAYQGHTHVIRFQAPKEYPKFNDLVYGKTGQGSDKGRKLHMDEPVYDDPILIKSDGFPTYHFANIVDDRLMKITHVIRGSEWMSSTPLHMALYDVFGWKPPLFAHVPLLVDKQGRKLSKRNFDSDISTFRDQGILSPALDNFAALLGWSHQRRNDVMDLKELEAEFDLKITKGNTIVSFDKLNFLQEQHARRFVRQAGPEFEQMTRNVAVALLEKKGAAAVSSFIGARRLKDVIATLLRAESLHYRSAPEFAVQAEIFFADALVKREKDSFKCPDMSLLPSFRTGAAALMLVTEESWTLEVHRANLANLQPNLQILPEGTGEKGWKREFYHYLRWALLGGTAGPSLPESMVILGRSACVDRLLSAWKLTEVEEIDALRPIRGHVNPKVRV